MRRNQLICERGGGGEKHNLSFFNEIYLGVRFGTTPKYFECVLCYTHILFFILLERGRFTTQNKVNQVKLHSFQSPQQSELVIALIGS